MTGVGGGAMMTPILVLVFGTAPLTAVGTDLWFAAITKLAVTGLPVRKGLIDWPIVRRLWYGSLPAAALTIAWISGRHLDDASVPLVRTAIGVAECLTAVGLLTGKLLWSARHRHQAHGHAAGGPTAAIVVGAFLGALVALTSIGAGALGAVALLWLYPSRLTPARLVATDIAHAIPLALVAGIGHLGIGQVDGALLVDLLAGSIPAAIVGATLSSRVPHATLRAALGAILLIVGVTMMTAP